MSAYHSSSPAFWPPLLLPFCLLNRTDRLVVRRSEARDRPAFIDLFASPEVGANIGGAQSRDDLDRTMPELPGQRPGLFVVELDDVMIGMITLEPREDKRSGPHLSGAFELSYLFLPPAWGRGHAAKTCAALLARFAEAHRKTPVVLYTQSANERSMRLAERLGFTEIERFEAYGAEQWFGRWTLL